jgi:capsular polysaccharide biosynthesis protein
VTKSPVKPNRKKYVIVGLVLGFLCSIFLSFLLEYLVKMRRMSESTRDND